MTTSIGGLIDLSIEACNSVQGLVKITPDTFLAEFLKTRGVDRAGSMFVEEVVNLHMRYQPLLVKLVGGFIGMSFMLRRRSLRVGG